MSWITDMNTKDRPLRNGYTIHCIAEQRNSDWKTTHVYLYLVICGMQCRVPYIYICLNRLKLLLNHFKIRIQKINEERCKFRYFPTIHKYIYVITKLPVAKYMWDWQSTLLTKNKCITYCVHCHCMHLLCKVGYFFYEKQHVP